MDPKTGETIGHLVHTLHSKHRLTSIVVSRQVLIDSRFSTVVCAPVYTACAGLTTQVLVGSAEGLKHDSSIHCDELVSLPKPMLTDFVGLLPLEKMKLLDKALRAALQLHGD